MGYSLGLDNRSIIIVLGAHWGLSQPRSTIDKLMILRIVLNLLNNLLDIGRLLITSRTIPTMRKRIRTKLLIHP